MKRREKHLEHLREVYGGLYTNLTRTISPKKRNTPNPFPKVDGFDLDAICRIVHDFYEANESPTLKKIHAAVKSQLNFPNGRENLRQILIKIGFRYRKRGRERIFYERGDIVSWKEEVFKEDQANPRARARERHSLFGRNMADGSTSEK